MLRPGPKQLSVRNHMFIHARFAAYYLLSCFLQFLSQRTAPLLFPPPLGVVVGIQALALPAILWSGRHKHGVTVVCCCSRMRFCVLCLS